MPNTEPSKQNVIAITQRSAVPVKKDGNVFQLHAKPVSKKWTKQACLESAGAYKTRKSWNEGERGAYNFAKNNGFFEECVSHMPTRVVKWSKSKCIESAKRYDSKNAWFQTENGAYKFAVRNAIFDECVAHMPIRTQHVDNISNNKWSKAKCIESANLHDYKSEWAKAESGAVAFAKKNGFYDECTSHMPERKGSSAATPSPENDLLENKFKKVENATLVLGLYIENKISA